MLKYKADLKTLLYIVITTGIFIYQWQYGFTWWIYVIYLHFSVAVSVMTHNHNHINIWTNKPLNVLTDWWLTVFYGIPIFTWIPTHNRNHHRFNNKEGDSSITYRHTEENHALSLLSYPSVSGFYQMTKSIIPYMKYLKENDRKTFYEYWAQIIVLVLWNAAFLILDWQKALLYVIIPQQVSGFAVFVFNYVQHVHADEESRWNHSRNFMWVNLFLFNNGYHTMHHEKANIHWSELPKYHKEIESNIDPVLIEKSFWGYIFRTYVISIFMPKYKSRSMRLERIASGHKIG
ncbi:MAG: fatty acid desaturase [Cytophagales bacterium]|nr:fatty acid desaturase [Cytophagales bacterium]